MFCTNPKSPIPKIHDVIADLTEVGGRSCQLIRILNRLGSASSPDTHNRYVTHHIMTQRYSTIWNDMPNDVFTVVSVNNFDILQSYASVYCSYQQQSYHGTTLQPVRPNPSLVLPPAPQHSSEQNVRVTMEPANVDINLSCPQIQPPGPAATNNMVPQLSPVPTWKCN